MTAETLSRSGDDFGVKGAVRSGVQSIPAFSDVGTGEAAGLVSITDQSEYYRRTDLYVLWGIITAKTFAKIQARSPKALATILP